ncbi:MAG: hypothetical protein FWD78_12025 [Treponema sp.]|nr:hypothetical protein [Treponema sp.]
MNANKINRYNLINRHNPHYVKPELNAPLSVGNGRFCYTADFTGLQTFFREYSYFPLCTMSEWSWHSYPGSDADLSKLRLTPFDTWGREVGYAVDGKGQEDLYDSLRQNPHRFNLGIIGLDLPDSALGDCADINQNLDMWSGCLDSTFTLWGQKVAVQTFVHSEQDTICLRLTSALVKNQKLRLRLLFPYGSHLKNGSDFSKPSNHTSWPEKISQSILNINRQMDDANYVVQVLMSEGTLFESLSEHKFIFGGNSDRMTIVFRFIREGCQLTGNIETGDFSADGFYDKAKQTTAAFWENYWAEGGAIDLSACTAADAGELERRIVLSQYLTAIQSRGSFPPAETGLTCNSWYGKFHLEMHYWHSAHFPLWNRVKELEKSLAWYKKIFGRAKEIAASQGYTGARWPKMCGPAGDNSPSPIALQLVWQQPHPILLAELCYRQNSSRQFLEEYLDIVLQSAEFMIAFMHWDGNSYVLGPPLIPAQERFDPRTVLNPGYEVEYFRWGLRTANAWLERLGMRQRPDFENAAAKLAAPAVYNGVFLAHQNCPDTFTKNPFNTDHPSMLGMLGLLPGENISKKIMNDTLDTVLSKWDLDSCWGWDFPMMAMTAARLGRTADAVRFLLMDSPKNTYLPNGHNAQVDRQDLPLYLPGNGGLLLAAAMMAAGWDNNSLSNAPGFPDNGTYDVKYENLHKYI